MNSSSSNQSPRSFEPSTLVELLRWRAVRSPAQRAYTFLSDKGTEVESLTYQELDQRAMAIATALQRRGTSGTPVLLLYPPGLEFIAAFFGCLYAGLLAVPIYPPRHNQSGARLRTIRSETQATLALTTTSILSSKVGTAAGQAVEHLHLIATDTLGNDQQDAWRDPQVNSDTLAFLQYTSGSTAVPKGVMLSHGNLLYNQRMIKLAFEHTEASIVLGWLPLYHDMGLIGNVLQPLYVGIPCILMSPMAFLLKPYRWLEAITRYQATTSGAPDFAYDLCVHKITPEQRATLDLSSWDLAFNGAEPVRYQTIEHFSNAFASCGFRRESFYPCYGLAEATLLVSGGMKTAAPVVHKGCDSWNTEPDANAIASKVVGCGTSKLAQKIVIADPGTFAECPPGVVGEIWVAGPNVSQGYWGRAKETEETFKAYVRDTGEGPFLRTGDLGFLEDGELFVQGRLKDIIIIRGCNHYPQDIEQTVERSHEALKPRCGAAFAIESNGKEKLVIVQEVERDYRNLNVEQVVADIRHAVAETHDLRVHAVVLLRSGSIPRTSSGKIQRAKCKADFLHRNLDVVGSFYAGQADDDQYYHVAEDGQALPVG
ncbi:MAG: AMP-dependent synthetase [Acidobacteria bacterium]|nr:MAG: AMP-dependent synthetase [Acidobacteriota bacterium]